MTTMSSPSNLEGTPGVLKPWQRLTWRSSSVKRFWSFFFLVKILRSLSFFLSFSLKTLSPLFFFSLPLTFPQLDVQGLRRRVVLAQRSEQRPFKAHFILPDRVEDVFGHLSRGLAPGRRTGNFGEALPLDGSSELSDDVLHGVAYFGTDAVARDQGDGAGLGVPDRGDIGDEGAGLEKGKRERGKWRKGLGLRERERGNEIGRRRANKRAERRHHRHWFVSSSSPFLSFSLRALRLPSKFETHVSFGTSAAAPREGSGRRLKHREGRAASEKKRCPSFFLSSLELCFSSTSLRETRRVLVFSSHFESFSFFDS